MFGCVCNWSLHIPTLFLLEFLGWKTPIYVQFKLRWLEVHRNRGIFQAAMLFDIPYGTLQLLKNGAQK